MLTACFDASGKEGDQKYLVVGGFVASANDWISFEQPWRVEVAKNNKGDFHRSEYGRIVQKGSERERHLLELVDIAKSHSYRKIGCIVPIDSFKKKVSAGVRDYFALHSYVMASLVAMSQIEKWKETVPEFRGKPIRYVFEHGDDGDTLLTKFVRSMGMADPLFEWGKKPKKPLPDGTFPIAFTPLQAADFLAYELFQIAHHHESGSRDPDYNYSFLDSFNKQIGDPVLLTEQDFERYEELFANIKRLEGRVV